MLGTLCCALWLILCSVFTLSSSFAAVSTLPVIQSVTGNTTGALLKVQRPENVGNDDAVTYLIQPYACSDAAGSNPVKIGEEIKGANSIAGANGERGGGQLEEQRGIF